MFGCRARHRLYLTFILVRCNIKGILCPDLLALAPVFCICIQVLCRFESRKIIISLYYLGQLSLGSLIRRNKNEYIRGVYLLHVRINHFTGSHKE